jgi:hypothetical protein
MTSDLALLAILAFSDASEGEECPEGAEPEVEDGAQDAPTLPRPAPRLHRRELRFEAPVHPHLLSRDSIELRAPCPELPLQWITTAARVTSPPPPAPGAGWTGPWVFAEVGLRTSAHWGMVRVYADGLARVDVQSSAERSEPTRTRLTERQRVGLQATPTEHVNFGLEFSRRPGVGIDPLPREARATAQLRLRFGL